MKKTIMTITATAAIIIAACCAAARAAEFWETYGERIVYNYSVHSGATPAYLPEGSRLSNGVLASLMAKSFSQALTDRIKEVSRQKSAYAVACIFTPEPQRCFVDGMLSITFEEVGFIKAPSFSNKFLKKVNKYYAYTLNGEETQYDRAKQAAGKVPQRKRFNPRFSFDLGGRQIIVSTPFYSFFGVYVEPKYGTSRGPSLTFMVRGRIIDADKQGVTFRYHVRRTPHSKGYSTLWISREGEVRIGNEFIVK